MQFVNIAVYKFVALTELQIQQWREPFKAQALECELKGTILLSCEGMNCFLAGTRDNIEKFKAFLAEYAQLCDLHYKESYSDHQPFSRMLVRLKREIIAFGHEAVDPKKETAPYLKPEQLKAWYDEKKEMVILDTRNDYEVALGTFEQAVDLNIENFRDFPNAVALLPEDMKQKPVVTFCTGGIRCEKAAEYMRQQGFEQVYQLEGGILDYFEQCGGAHYQGECFVFDKRVALDPQLTETKTQQCYACRSPLPLAEQQADGLCPHCQKPADGQQVAA